MYRWGSHDRYGSAVFNRPFMLSNFYTWRPQD
jgi:hypothetical protein